MTQIQRELSRFIVVNFLLGQPDAGFTDETSFFEHGIIDSTGVLELASFLELRYAITIEDEELVPENLDSIANLLRFVERKLQVAA
jgi:acyl carrier protein